LPRPGTKQGGHRAGQGGDSYYLEGFGGFLATLEEGKTKRIRLRYGFGVIMARLRRGCGVAGVLVNRNGKLFDLSTGFVGNCRFFCSV